MHLCALDARLARHHAVGPSVLALGPLSVVCGIHNLWSRETLLLPFKKQIPKNVTPAHQHVNCIDEWCPMQSCTVQKSYAARILPCYATVRLWWSFFTETARTWYTVCNTDQLDKKLINRKFTVQLNKLFATASLRFWNSAEFQMPLNLGNRWSLQVEASNCQTESLSSLLKSNPRKKR